MKGKKGKVLKVASLFLSCLVILLTGCTPANETSTKQQTTSKNSQTETTPAKAEPAKKKNGEKIVIGFSQRRVAGSDWYTNLIKGAEEEAKRRDVELTVLDAQGDVAKQVSGVEDLIAQNVDAVIMNPQDPSGVIPATTRLNQNDIPLIAVNSNLDAKANAVSFVSDDPRDTGYKTGWELAKAASEKYGDKVIKAAMVSGYPKELVSQYRRNGMISGWTDFMLEKYGKSNLNLVAERFGAWVPDKALPEMQDIGTAHPDLKVVFCMSDTMLPGIYTGLKNTGLNEKVLIGSIDGTKDAIRRILEEPKSGLVVTVSNDPRVQGADAVKMAIDVVQGKQVPSTHYIENPVITSKNAKDMYDPNSSY
ncbi:sugar ABC transporter substrate-binding protein [Peribacillus cavernae]|uniref:Sugar ABC transporter substrate-binding protein n=1 Tax=Peribacillus cavernae TaxID=1674310 RepID=A0A433HVT0_9BACI|nr:substrate-binding domain-containing protein [Peribacillus cavernae]MDQ0220699.1 ABC-type sugar transport system substrate-binding protein [Peribacillus cavernae]RUQ32418.1 sugar ABC transporter substrate-binding protein [Peribacillus cavernae]